MFRKSYDYNKICRLLLFACLLTFINPQKGLTQPSELVFSKLSRQHGLPNSSVTSICQDKNGYIWLGTEEGLGRYDGYHVTVYKSKGNVNSGLSNNRVSQVITDSKNRIWVATNYGLNLYDRGEDRFISFINDPNKTGNTNINDILCIYEDSKGIMWVGTKAGLLRYDEQTRRLENKIYKPSAKKEPQANNINCIYEEKPGILWIGTYAEEFKQFNIATGVFKPLNNPLAKALENIRIITIKKDLNGMLWIGTNGNGLFQYHPVLKTVKRFTTNQGSAGISGNVIKSILCDHLGNIWVGTENGGVNLLKSNSDRFLHYENDLRNPSSFSQKTASCLFEDSQDNIWIGTHIGGVNLYSPHRSIFKNYISGIWPGALSYKDIKTFYEDKQGDLWVGTDGGGINILNKGTLKFKQYRNDPDNLNSISSDAVLSITQDQKGTIWVGTWGGGLNRYNRDNGTFTRYLHSRVNKNSISSNHVWCVYEDKKENFWIGTFDGGLNLFDRKTQKFKRIISAPDGKSSFTGNNIYVIQEDKNGDLWFGTEDGGLNYLTSDKQKFLHYFSSPIELTDPVRTLFIDSKNRLWAGKTGLYLYDYKRKSFFPVSSNPYLINKRIQAITQDDKGFFWISTYNGLIKYHPDTKYFKRFTDADGLQGLEFMPQSGLKTRSGHMIFGGTQGFNIFHPDSLKSKSYTYPVYLTDFKIFNKTIRHDRPDSPLDKYIGEANKITLDYNQSVFSIEYAALNYVSPAKTQYAYKLHGFDKNWNYVGSQRKATYTNLDPGSYTFYVKASTPEGTWNARTTSIQVIVRPPFWRTVWFKTLVFLITLATLFLILYYRRKFELQAFNDKKSEEMHKLQLQFFTNISHEFRTPLTLILGALDQILKQDSKSVFTRHYHTIHRNANRLMHLISELMDFRKTETGSLKLKVMPGNFSAFLNEIIQEFKEEAVVHNIAFTVTQDKEYDHIWFDRQVLEKILLNLINNSFKYTPDNGSIEIEVLSALEENPLGYSGSVKMEQEYKGGNYLYISIKDTGIGISKNGITHLFERYYRISDHHLGSGIGLAFVKSLTFLHKGNIFVYSEHRVGTQIVIAIPCSKEDYHKEELWTSSAQVSSVQLESVLFKETLRMPAKNNNKNVEKTIKPVLQHCILIVEDNEELRAYFKEILEPDYKIIEADNGEAGVNKAKSESTDLIISDIMMPVMDGIRFCSIIKNDLETSHIPFILLTAKDALESRLEGVDSGADYYFSKPVNMDMLLLTIKNLFKQRQNIRERYLKNHQVEVHQLAHSAIDKKFIKELINIIEGKLEDPDLTVEYVCRELGFGRTKLYKKIKDITGGNINEFIRITRFKKAMEIMTHEDVLINEVMYRVGILSKSYFTTTFKKEFGITPSQFQQQLNRKN